MSDRVPARHTRPALALKLAILLAAAVLIAVTWAFVLISEDTEEREAQVRVEATASNLALAVEWQLNRQLQAVDQMIQDLAAQWKADPIHFDPGSWRRYSALLGNVSLQVFLLDTQGYVMSATRPDMMGLDMSAANYFTVQRGLRGQGLFVGPAIRWKTTGRWEIDLSRRLEDKDGSFAGAIVVAYDPWSLTSLLQQVDLLGHGLIALVGGDGAVRALVSPGEVRPGEDISGAPMFSAAVQRPLGTWTGPSAPDGIARVHAFRRLPDQDLTIVVGIGRAEALQTATTWAGNATLFASGVTVSVLAMAALLIREVRAAGRRERRLQDDRNAIEQAYGALEAAKSNAEAKTAQIETTLDGMSDGVMVLDRDLRLTQWNDRFPSFTGIPRELLQVGQPIEVLLRGQAIAGEFGEVEDIEEVVRSRVAQLRQAPASIQLERSRPDGSTIEMRRSRLPDGGIVTLYADVSARKRAAEVQQAARRLAEAATEQKSRFVAIVSHEIRTPLNAVVNSLALLDESGLSPQQRRLADTARQAGDALMELVQDILELSKTEAGQLAVRPTVFDLRPVLDGVQGMFQTQAAARGIRLVVDMAPEVPKQMRADVGRLRQVLMNLVSNAAKFAAPGVVVIQAAQMRVSGQQCLYLAVQDQGPRIAAEEAAQLFQPFSRLDNARAFGTPGTGLGLAICERLTRLMGGDIGLREAPGGGNEFWLTLPLVPAQPAERPADRRPVAHVHRRRAAVLLVEDIPANHLVTATLLRREGHRIDIAESGAEAIRLAKTRPYDLIFMDLLMPGMNGFEATRQIRALPGPAGVVPIVALTANTAPEDRARCLAAGMNDMLGKPVRPSEMFAMLARGDWRLPAARPEAPPAQAPSAAPPPEVRAPAGQIEPAPLLDIARLADLQQGLSQPLLESLIGQCLSDMQGRLPELHAALTEGNAYRVEMAAHALAGMAGTYGLLAISAKMRRIIRLAREGDLAAAAALGAAADSDLAKASSAVQQHLFSLAA